MPISRRCWKYLTLTYNVFFAVSALVLFGFSGYFLYKLFIYRSFIGITVQYPAILLLMIGIITCSVAWIGWRTTSSMHQLHVTVAGILILAVVVAEFAIFVWAMVIWDNVDVEIKTSMTSYFTQTTQAQGNLTTAADAIRWDKLHVKMQCCGLSGPGDYSTSGHVPFSCCGQGPLDALQKPYTSDCTTLYQRGCAKPLHEYAREQILYVAMAALVASVVQSVGVFCTFSLAYAIGNRFNSSNSSSVRHRVSAPDDALLEASRIVTRDHEKATAPALSRY